MISPIWTFLLVGLIAGASPKVEVETIDGRVVRGSVVELSSERVTIRSAEGRLSLATKDLMGLWPKDRPAHLDQPAGAWIELVDGSSLVAVDYSAGDGQGRIVTGEDELTLPRGQVAVVRLQPLADSLASEWARIRGEKFHSDLLVVRKGDSIDYHQGVINTVSGKAVEFEFDGEVLPVKRSKVFALVYYHPAERELPAAIGRISDAAGSRWAVRSVALVEDALQWTTPGGLTVTRRLAEIERIDFSAERIVYLGDLKPESVRWTPYFGMDAELPSRRQFHAPKSDRSLTQEALRLGGKAYRKGLAMHSRTEVVYRLPDRFRRLKATVGIDDGVRPQGNVRLVISGDGRVLLETAVSGTDPPQDVDIDLAGVRRLSILADFGENLDVADHLDLGDARVIK